MSAPQHDAMRPSNVRWHILLLLSLITALTYLDRLNLGIAVEPIQREFGFSDQTMGWILSAFIWGYALCQVPGGWLGDRFGPRGVLTLAMLWWSAFTALTTVATRLPWAGWLGAAWSFGVVRFLIGVGEASSFPNSNKMVANWMGENRRGVGNSFFLAGLGAGGVLTPILIARISKLWGWRSSFHACAALGVLLALAWRLYARNRPEEHPRVNRAELELIQGGGPSRALRASGGVPSRAPMKSIGAPERRPPWRKMLSSVSAWGLMASYFCEAYPNYIFYTWFFKYLVSVRGLTLAQGSFATAAPFLAIVVLAPVGGWVSDRAVARHGKRRGRQAAAFAGMTVSAGLLATGAHTVSNPAAIALLAIAAGFNLFATSTWWATCIDLSRDFSGSLSALMNMCGNLGGSISPILTAYIATRFGWTAALDFAALVTLVGGLLWVAIDAGKPIEA